MEVGNVSAQTYRLGIELQVEPLPGMSMPAAEPSGSERTDGEQGQLGPAPERLEERKFDEKLSRGFEEINKRLALMSNEMEYSYHKPTRSIAVKVFNSETKEVVREIPPQKALDALAKMWELAGILVDEKR